jgi:selenocysteine lyase/cysteine desulfurase
VAEFAQENIRRGSLAYADWLATEARLRRQLAGLVNAPSADDIALVGSTSAGLSLVAYGLDWQPGDEVVTAAQEFPSNRVVWESLAPRHSVRTRLVDLKGRTDPEQALIDALDTRTRLLAISAVQYASGLRLDLQGLGEACRERGVLFCVDAIQQVGAAPFDVQAIGADFAAADGHKWMLGPEGVALFYCRAELRERLRLHQYGWHMVEHHNDFTRRDWAPAASARRFEPGSPNMLGTVALAESTALLLEIGLDEVGAGLADNVGYLIESLSAEGFEILSPRTPERRLGIVVFRHPTQDTEALYRGLMQRRVLCAQRGGGVRFSPHWYTPRTALDTAVQHAVEVGTSGRRA